MSPLQQTAPARAPEDAERYRALFDGSKDAIYLSHEDGRILRVNPAFVRLFGYDEDELHGVSARSFYVDPGDRDRFHDEIADGGAVKDFETLLRRRDGGCGPASSRPRPG